MLALIAANPDDAYAHYNAGYSYLRGGDHEKSLEHFSECLRLDPTFEAGRIGILEALRARYAVYRWYLKAHFAVDGRSQQFRHSQWLLPLAAPLIIVSSLLHAVATFFLLFERRARIAMDFNDKINGILGGGGLFLGLMCLLGGAALGSMFAVKLGATLVLTTLAIAFSLADEIPEKLRM